MVTDPPLPSDLCHQPSKDAIYSSAGTPRAPVFKYQLCHLKVISSKTLFLPEASTVAASQPFLCRTILICHCSSLHWGPVQCALLKDRNMSLYQLSLCDVQCTQKDGMTHRAETRGELFSE